MRYNKFSKFLVIILIIIECVTLYLMGMSLSSKKTINLLELNSEESKEKLKSINVIEMSAKLNVGKETLNDIVLELLKPGRDIRDDLPKPMLRSDLLELKDLTPDMVIKGTVRNVVDFGAFIDIGVHQDGLVHISRITDKYLKHPSEVLSVGDIVDVKVIEVDVDRKRISLTMKDI